MSAVSGRQYRAMAAAKGGHSTLGIPKSVGAEFVKETSKKRRRGFARLRPDSK